MRQTPTSRYGYVLKFVAVVGGKQQQNVYQKKIERREEQNISSERVIEDNTRWVGLTIIHIECTITLCVPPTTFISLWLRNKIHFTVMAGKPTVWFLIRNEEQNISFIRVSDDNIRWVGCTNIHILYYNIVCVYYYFCVQFVHWTCRLLAC